MNNNSNSDTSKVMKTRFELPKTAQSRNKSDRTENYAGNIQERIQHGKKKIIIKFLRTHTLKSTSQKLRHKIVY